MSSCTCSHLNWCGTNPYVPAKQTGLEKRGLLRPDVWAAVYLLATDPSAAVNRVCTSGDRRMEVISRGVTVIVVDYCSTGVPVVLTAYVAGDPTYPAGAILSAAGAVDHRNTVDLDERLRGLA